MKKRKPFTEDEKQDFIDNALSGCLQALLPLTAEYEVEEIQRQLIGSIQTHFETELQAMAVGPADDCYDELSEDNQAASYEFLNKIGRYAV